MYKSEFLMAIGSFLFVMGLVPPESYTFALIGIVCVGTGLYLLNRDYQKIQENRDE